MEQRQPLGHWRLAVRCVQGGAAPEPLHVGQGQASIDDPKQASVVLSGIMWNGAGGCHAARCFQIMGFPRAWSAWSAVPSHGGPCGLAEKPMAPPNFF